MSLLPKSPTLEAQERIADFLDQLIRQYDPTANIVLRAWQEDIKTVIASALSKLRLFVFVEPASYKPTDTLARGNMAASMEIVVRSNGALKDKNPEVSAGWDAEDLANLIVSCIDGQKIGPSDSIYTEARVIGYTANVLGLEKAIKITLGFEIYPSIPNE